MMPTPMERGKDSAREMERESRSARWKANPLGLVELARPVLVSLAGGAEGRGVPGNRAERGIRNSRTILRVPAAKNIGPRRVFPAGPVLFRTRA